MKSTRFYSKSDFDQDFKENICKDCFKAEFCSRVVEMDPCRLYYGVKMELIENIRHWENKMIKIEAFQAKDGIIFDNEQKCSQHKVYPILLKFINDKLNEPDQTLSSLDTSGMKLTDFILDNYNDIKDIIERKE